MGDAEDGPLAQDTDFLPARRKRSKQIARNRRLQHVGSLTADPLLEGSHSTFDEIEMMMERTRNRILSDCGSQFILHLANACYEAYMEEMGDKIPTEIVCYALGRFSLPFEWGLSCRLQLILLMKIRDKFKIPVCIFDPAFSASEKEYLTSSSCNFELIESNENCERIANEPTIFYMVHGDWPLYANLYNANCKARTEANVVVFGNPVESSPVDIPVEYSRIVTRVLPVRHSSGLFDAALSDTVLTFISAIAVNRSSTSR